MRIVQKKTAEATLRAALARRMRATSGCLYEASVIEALDRIESPGLGTFGVAFVGDRPTLFYDPDTLTAMSEEELDATLKHEVYHLTLYHPARGAMLRQRFRFANADPDEKRLQQRAHALAADYAVNELLKMDVPSIEYPNKHLGYWALPRERNLPGNRTYEEYFRLVLAQLREEAVPNADAPHGTETRVILVAVAVEDRAELAEKSGESAGAGAVPGSSSDSATENELKTALNDMLSNKPKPAPKSASSVESEGAKTETKTKPESEPEADAPPTLLTLSELMNAIELALAFGASAMRGCGKSIPNRYGSVRVIAETPEGVGALLDAMREVVGTGSGGTAATRPSMRSVSRSAAARAQYMRGQESYGPAFARRLPLVPGVFAASTLCAGIILDTSGSMDKRRLGFGIGAVRQVLEELHIAEGAIFECDDREVRVLEISPGIDLPDDIIGRGGTDFDPGLLGVMAWSRRTDTPIDIIVYITDGDARRPTVRVPVPTIWAGVGPCYPVLADVPGNTNVVLSRDC